ncbi:nucleotidyltransferase domain-containing protein [Paenibacillus gansuensis]|uniref:Nucleotidyltransferase domain-containing protein n=1 Tax=Paenibacillus gansuensis TaxID=306542 RepID=A0ABW5PBE4_9BACL
MNIQSVIDKVVERLRDVNGVEAVVLGGSRAKGTHHAKSDIDIGLYYDGSKGLDMAGLKKAASALDDEHREEAVTDIGGWGPWINGGGWLTVDSAPVDILYRDLKRVEETMDQCLSGTVTIDYQPGHPHGFLNAVYVAEMALCKVLWDPGKQVEKLKSRLHPYPAALKEALINKFLWEAGFALETGRKGIAKGDLSYVAGCCFRSVSCLNQVLFALNECYWMNEKGASAIAASFRLVPPRYEERVNAVFRFISDDPNTLEQSMDLLQQLVTEVNQLL